MSYVRGTGTAVRNPGLGQSNINSTTIWTPSGGYGGGGSTAYVAPTMTPAPACSSGPPGTSDSAECIALLLATQQGNMQAANKANYTSDEGTCNANFAENAAQRASLGLPALPNTCGSNTFDLVPTGGYTGDASVSGPQTIVDANGNPVSITPGAISGSVPNTYVAPVPAATSSTPAPVSGGGSSDSTGTASNYVDQATSFLGGDVSVAGSSFPVWGLLAAGAALLFFMGGRH